MSSVQGELKRALYTSKSPTELHMNHAAKQRAGVSFEVTSRNIEQKLENMKIKKK